MNHLEFKAKFFEKLAKKSHMVLATSTNDRVTARSISPVVIGEKLYFQTDSELLKYSQLTHNPKIALCELDLQIEGIAKVIGHPFEDQNKFFVEAFSQKHPGSFNNYTHLKTEVVVEITLVLIQLWSYEDGKPFIYNLNLENNDFSRRSYPFDNVSDFNNPSQ